MSDAQASPESPGTGIRIDFIFSSIPYERQAIERSVAVDMAGSSVSVASAEDPILHKLFAGRPRDIEDTRGVADIKRQYEVPWWDVVDWSDVARRYTRALEG